MVFSTLAFWVVLGASVVNAAPASRATQSLPSFVLENAPISYLYSKEEYWPADIAEHLTHVTPQVDKKNVADSVTFSSIATLSNDTYLTSKDDVQDGPSWLLGVQPDSTGFTQAPATIITVEKPGGIIDAFYFYFYSFDFGEVRYGLWSCDVVSFNEQIISISASSLAHTLATGSIRWLDLSMASRIHSTFPLTQAAQHTSSMPSLN